MRAFLIAILISLSVSAMADDAVPLDLPKPLPLVTTVQPKPTTYDTHGFEIMPDLYSALPPASVYQSQNQADAVNSAFKAACIQSGFQDSYNQFKNKFNYFGSQQEDSAINYLDRNTFISKNQIFIVAGLVNVASTKSVGTSFSDPFFPAIHHAIRIGVDNSSVTVIDYHF